MRSLPRRWLAAIAAVVLVTVLASGALAAPSSQSSSLVQVATNSTLGRILVNAQGMTLYTLSTEAGGSVQCTGSCLQAWPPLVLAAGASTPTLPAGTPGTLGVITRQDVGQQVTYNGFPLYMYSGDSKAGDTNGEGVPQSPGTWHAAKVAAAAATPVTSPTAGPTATSAPPLEAVFPPQAASSAKLGAILTDANGRTLYYLTSETGSQFACTGKCLSFWPPLDWPSGASAPKVSGFPGAFGSVARPDGSMQVTYNSSPLYIFINDKAPGDTNGEGVKAFGGTWHAVTPQLVPLSAALGAKLTVRITTTGSTVWGKVTVRYQNGGRTVTHTCASASCRFAVSAGITARFSQSPVNAATWPFHAWRMKAGTHTRTVMGAGASFSIRGNSTVTAVYVVA
jgi:predicted lipoprotein with Yx(FWY)xxD motif